MATTRAATVAWQGGLVFEALTATGHSLEMDASPEHGGEHRGPSPMELLLAGLGGCTGMDVISILRKMRQKVTAYRVEVRGSRRAEHPQIYTKIQLEHVVRGRGLDSKQVARAVELSATRYCSASAMLGAMARLEHSYRIEAEE